MTARTTRRSAFLRGGRRGAWRRVQVRRVAAAGLVGAGVWAAVAAMSPPAPVREQAVAAAADLPAGHRIASTDLQLVAVDPQIAPESRLAQGEAAVGQVLAAPMERGELVTAARLRPASGLARLAAAERALHVPVADRGAIALVRPGDRVDVVEVATGKTVGARLLVLSIDQGGAAASGLSGGEQTPAGVVLAVPPAAVQRIVPAAVGGDGGVQLAVRPDSAP